MIQDNPYRPNNVKLVVVLESIVAVFLVGGGTAILLLASISVTTLLLSGVHIILGLIAFPAAYGLWAAKQCAWRFALVLSIVSILSSAAQEYVILTTISNTRVTMGSFYGTIVFSVVSLVIIYYLTRPNVKAFYGFMLLNFLLSVSSIKYSSCSFLLNGGILNN